LTTKFQKIEAEGESIADSLAFYTRLGYSVGLIADLFEVSAPTVRKWFRDLSLPYRKFPLQSLKCNTPKGNPELMRELGKQKAKIIDGVNVPQRERELGLAKGTIGKRLKYGWAVQAALTVKKGERVVARSRASL
jgi:hypothetical protein